MLMSEIDKKLSGAEIDALADECVKRILANDHEWASVVGKLYFVTAFKVIGLAFGRLALAAKDRLDSDICQK